MSKVATLLGSKSDEEVIGRCFEYLTRFGIQNEVKISSAHRQPEETAEFVKNAEKNGFSIIVAAGGMAAHLPGLLRQHFQ